MTTVLTTRVFRRWYAQLKDERARYRIQARIDRAEDGNLGDVKPVGGDVFEMRIHYGAGYRVYCVRRGVELVILLAGGTKSSQRRDIAEAIALAQTLEEETPCRLN